MSKKIQLTIPKPCHEDWDKMTPVEKGKFCGSCQKQVVDFSVMSDRQVAEFFKKPSTGSVCGRFMTDQLDREIDIPKKRIPWLKYFFQIALPAFFVSKVSAQTHKVGRVAATKGTPVTIVQTTGTPVVKEIEKDPAVCVKSAEDTLPPILPMMGAVAYVEEKILQGKVVDAETGLVIAGVYMQMNSSAGKEMVSVNTDGSFFLTISRKVQVNYVEVSKPGYISQKIKYKDLQKTTDGSFLIRMKKEKEMMLKGEIAVNIYRKTLIGDTIILPKSNDIVKGMIVNENNEPIPYASIQAGMVMNFFVADENGEFEIKDDQIPGKKILTASAAGYENASVEAERKYFEGETLVIVLKAKNTLPEVVVTTGFVQGMLKRAYTTGAVSSTCNQLVTVKNNDIKKENPLLNTDEEKLVAYPNPLPSGATLNLNIRFNKKEPGYYQLQLVSLSGQVVYQQEAWIDEEARVLSIDLPAIAAGNYYLVLVNKQTGKKRTEKIVIQ